MLKLTWRETAVADLFSIVDYISDDNLHAAQQLKDDIDTKAEQLRNFPKMGRVGRVTNTRELVAWKNYIIVYQENMSGVHILRILHAAQQWPPT